MERCALHQQDPKSGPPPDPRNGNPQAKIRIRSPPTCSQCTAKAKVKDDCAEGYGAPRVTDCCIRREALGWNPDLPVTPSHRPPSPGRPPGGVAGALTPTDALKLTPQRGPDRRIDKARLSWAEMAGSSYFSKEKGIHQYYLNTSS